MVHAAISGSTNALLHLPAIAREFGAGAGRRIPSTGCTGAPTICWTSAPPGAGPRSTSTTPGGVPRIMEEIKSMLHLDVMTVTGKTLGENLEDLKHDGFYERCDASR